MSKLYTFGYDISGRASVTYKAESLEEACEMFQGKRDPLSYDKPDYSEELESWDRDMPYGFANYDIEDVKSYLAGEDDDE